MRTYKPTAHKELPPCWAEAIHDHYTDLGYRVEIGWTDEAKTQAWVRVHGLHQHELNCHLNDPIGKPGEQDPRNVQTTIKRYRRKVKPLDPEIKALVDEERRYLRPDGD